MVHDVMVKNELDLIRKAIPGKPDDSFAHVPSFHEDIIRNLIDIVTFKFHAAHELDSAAAFFLCDNVGLPGIAHYLKVVAVCERADNWRNMDFLAKRGARPELGAVTGFSAAQWSQKDKNDVLYAFENLLALAKVGLKLVDRAYAAASRHHDAESVLFFTEAAAAYADKVREWSYHVTHLKLVADDKHAIKNFDRELACNQAQDYARAGAIEAVICPTLQIGVYRRKLMMKNACAEADVQE